MTRVLLDETPRAQIGCIVLQADETLEDDLRRLLPADLSCLVSRVPSSPTLTQESLREMAAHLTHAASLFPRGASFRAVAYGCTSATAELGAAHVADLIASGVETPAVTDPVSALIAACRHLGVTRIGLVSPYVDTVSTQLIETLSENGITTATSVNFDEPSEAKVARIAETTLRKAAREVDRMAECDAVFLSCTNLRTLDVIAEIEADIGKPVLSSNQVLAWHLCQLADVDLPDTAPGALFK
ncbi:MAG: maleate cis-trans isomerase family protein [Paracoccaceae bacterium]